MFTQADIDWCAAECKRQKSGEESVAWMARALNTVRDQVDAAEYVEPTPALLIALGRLVEPVQNVSGFRTLPIKIKGVIYPVVDFYRQTQILCDRYNDDTFDRDEWYYRFEKVHPFFDGNGRVGALIWNAMNDIRGRLAVPPRFTDLEERFG